MYAAVSMIVVVTQKTALEELVERFNTLDQARFYIEHSGASFQEYQDAHDAYMRSLQQLREALPRGVRHQFIERSFLPNYLFETRALVAALGRDGLVVNTAKYLSGQLLVGFNPDPARIDGVLVRVPVGQAADVFALAQGGVVNSAAITMARAALSDGQSLHAVNDLFIGQRTHVSARYRLQYRDVQEDQSSSGIIVSTGAGSTGWLRSILTGAAGVVEAVSGPSPAHSVREDYRFDWDARHLVFSVREPFVSRASSAQLVFGRIPAGEELVITSQMPQNGVIFSDGVESDFLEFNSGRIARVSVADRKVRLVLPLS
jgi:NAD kinase